jgi:hypothetical protein
MSVSDFMMVDEQAFNRVKTTSSFAAAIKQLRVFGDWRLFNL